MVKKATDRSTLGFTYDSFGWLRSYADELGGTSVEIIIDFEGETLQRKSSDSLSELIVSRDFAVQTQPDGSRIVHHRLFSREHILGTVINIYESASSPRLLGGNRRSVNIPFTDTKSSVTRIYNGEDSELREIFDYDDYGSLDSDTSEETEKGRTSTYEGRRLDDDTGLLDFGGRWYDPLVGRFTSGNDIVDLDHLMRTDGLNHFVFENNDPINPNEENVGKAFGGFATTVAINAAIGAATGALGAVASPARVMAGTSRLASKIGLDLAPKTISILGKLTSVGGKALIGGAASVLTGATNAAVSNVFYGTDHDLCADTGSNFAMGAAVGAFVGFIGLKSSKTPNRLMGINKSRAPFKLGQSQRRQAPGQHANVVRMQEDRLGQRGLVKVRLTGVQKGAKT